MMGPALLLRPFGIVHRGQRLEPLDVQLDRYTLFVAVEQELEPYSALPDAMELETELRRRIRPLCCSTIVPLLVIGPLDLLVDQQLLGVVLRLEPELGLVEARNP
jgi:hypothetical protein